MRFNQQSTFFIPLQPPPTSCTCKCNSRNTVTHRISACSSRWATIIISTLVLVTFVIVAGVVFVVLNETQGKSNSQGKFFHRNASITNCLWFDWFSFCFCFCFFQSVGRLPLGQHYQRLCHQILVSSLMELAVICFQALCLVYEH